MAEDGQIKEMLTKPWDTAREVPIIGDEQTPWKLIKLLRTISVIAVAITVFGLALCSKTSFLLLITLSNEDTQILSAEQKPLALLCIGCAIVSSSVLLFLKSIWKACYKTSKLPRKSTVALVLFFEFLVSFGVAVLTIVTMPHLDIVTNVTLLNAVAILSALLQAVAQCAAKECNRFLISPIIAFILILLGYCLFVALYIMKDPTDTKMIIWVGLAVGASLLASFNWWENYLRLICEKSRSCFLKNLFKDMTKCQNILHIFTSLLRIVVTTCVLGAYVPLAKLDWHLLTSASSLQKRVIIFIIGVQLISSALCQWFALLACKMHAIRRCFILPLYFTSLAVVAVFIIPVIVYYQEYKISLNTTESITFTSYCNVAMDARNQSLNSSVFSHLVWDVTQTLCFLDMSKITDIGMLTGAAASWWIGLLLATLYVWNLNIYRIQKTQDLFIRRLYEGAFIEQSLLLNTRFHIQTKRKKNQFNECDSTAMVYLCATMWHETYEEMMNIIISIFRLDKYRPKTGPEKEDIEFDDFTFEAHIYFDDAFESVEGNEERQLNEYAKSLVVIIAEVYGIFNSIDEELFRVQHIPDQKVIRTPYGGRLVIKMPHGNNIIVHFKDKNLIRHKKRWSQVMYLYYLLGWKLMTKYYNRRDQYEDDNTLRQEIQKEKHNTYLLALDGDTDFHPASVMLLIDRLKMYPRVGAACGRIHPTGSGPVVWFQKFEYAVSHWLQKTAEHVFGCVLCSPGCFSLFRAEALMDDNVMKKYSTKSTEASQYIQYDQGEDRWLCTLLLKQGWRVEYNAASDAYTNAPEDFKELYNQRRRWGPSTMANVVDLLGSTNIISKRNSSMSKPFMFYQLFNMLSTVLAPSTICLMIAGSLSFILGLSNSVALVVAVIPPAIYLGLCFKLKADTQITLAAALSALYAFLMLVVTMSIIGSMVKSGTIFTPSSIFIIAMSVIYVVTALMHPQELPLVFYGFLYIICIPSAYLLLTIYSMVNMNSVSWGTRETKSTAGAVTPAVTKETPKQRVKSSLQRLFSWVKCCKKPSQRSQDIHENIIPESIQLEPQPQNTIVDDPPEDRQEEVETNISSTECWITQLQSFPSDVQMQLQEESFNEEEKVFWEELREKYLYPLPIDKEKQKEMQSALKGLRNKINFSFFFVNALWLVATFTLEIFQIFSIKINMVDINLNNTGNFIQIEPLSFMFILGFAVSVLLQFVGMFYHRVYTLIHYIAYLETEPIQQKRTQKAKEKKEKALQDSIYSTTDSNYSSGEEDESFDGEDDDDSYIDPNAGTMV